MCWPLAWNTIIGTIPGLFLGGVVRIVYLPDPRPFKLFVGIVLCCVGARIVHQVFSETGASGEAAQKAEARMRSQTADRVQSRAAAKPAIRTLSWSLSRTEYEFYGERFSFHTTGLFVLSLVVGLIGGVYGIGGGAIIVPFVVAFFGLPVHTIAGAALMGTCVTSVGGVIFYELIGPHLAQSGEAVSPDWLLGFLFGIGGFVGMYMGAAAQKYVRAAVIRPGLGLVITVLGLGYVVGLL